MKINFSKIKSDFFENKNLNQTILKNTFWLTIAEVSSKIISFIAIIWLSRYLGPESYGKVAFAASFVAIFSFIIDFGFPTLAAREISRDKSKSSQYIENIMGLEIIFGLVTLLLIFFSAGFITKDKEFLILIYLLGISAILDVLTLFFQSIFCAHEKMEYTAISKIIQAVALSILMITTVIGGYNILFVGYAYLISSFLATTVSLILVWKYFSKFFIKLNKSFCKSIIKESWPIALLYFASLVFQSLDIIMIQLLRPQYEVGLYGASSRLIFSTYLVITILYSVFLPPISRAFKDGGEKLKIVVEKYGLFTFATGFPISIGGAIISTELISFFYGRSYIESSGSLTVLCVGLLFTFAWSFYGYCLVFFNKQKSFLIANIIGIIANLLFDLILIPYWGIVGASVSSVFVQIIITTISWLEFRRVVKIDTISIIMPTIISSGVMAAIVLLFKTLGILNPLILILVGIISYFSIYYFLYLNNKKIKKILQPIEI